MSAVVRAGIVVGVALLFARSFVPVPGAWAASVRPRSLPSGGAAGRVRESLRVRIANKGGGSVSVSLDSGRQFVEVGQVLRPATASSPGFPAAAGVAAGSVAMIAVDRWLIRCGGTAGSAPRVFGLTASSGAGGDAFAELNLNPTASLFTAFAPPLGSHVFLQSGGHLTRITSGYQPRAGDVWVIVVEQPVSLPSEIVFTNREDGPVTAVGRDGSVTRIGRVVKPVRGVGRYPATELASAGRIVSHHPGAILVATCGAAGSSPSGFVIQSSVFADGASRDAPSVLLVEPDHGTDPSLFLLPIPLRGAGSETRVDMRYPGKAWEPVPARAGSDTHAFVSAEEQLVERFRVRIGDLAADALAKALPRPAPKVPAGNAPVYRGTLTISANVTGNGIQLVKFLLDGRLRAIDNVDPYSWEWDTRTSENGEHTIEIQGVDLDGKLINRSVSKVIVAN